MSFAYLGLTHCEECRKSLKMNEYFICNECKEKQNKGKIDIDSIEEFIIDLDFNDLDKFEDGMQIEDKINQLIQAVKQLNKEIKELKEKK